MEPVILESRFEKSSNRTTLFNSQSEQSVGGSLDRESISQSRPITTGSVEMWSWLENLEDWGEEDKTLLKKSWRPSTMTTYKPVWKRWVQWSLTNKISCWSPSADQVARYLTELNLNHKLAYKKNCLHKSVIATFCIPVNKESISSNFLVKKILKSISLSNPKQHFSCIWILKF